MFTLLEGHSTAQLRNATTYLGRAIAAALLCSTSLALASPGIESSDLTDKARYTIAYQEHAVGADLLSRGEFAAAAEHIRSGFMFHDHYYSNTNLCVALISQDKYEEAEGPCRAAVRHSSVSNAAIQSRMGAHREKKNRRALAWSNLGVLQALRGEAR